jgi:hypothetical protein
MSKIKKSVRTKEEKMEEDSKENFFQIVQYLVFWISLFVMMAIAVFVFKADFKVRQKTISIPINLENKVNICLPEESEEESD